MGIIISYSESSHFSLLKHLPFSPALSGYAFNVMAALTFGDKDLAPTQISRAI